MIKVIGFKAKVDAKVDVDANESNDNDKLANIKELINIYDKVGEKAREYIKDVIRIELSDDVEMCIDIDEFIKMIPWLGGSRINLIIKKEDVENNEWCKRFIDLLSIYMPHCSIILEDDDTLGIGL